MKKYISIWFVINSIFLKAQINLVPNPSFEDTVPCSSSFLPAAYWGDGGMGSPDYFNEIMPNCPSANNGFNTVFGYQSALTGNAFMGIGTYYQPYGSNYREAIQTQLSNILNFNKKYCISFYVNLANAAKYASDDIGCYLSATSNIPFPASAQLYNTQGSIIIDTANWTLIKGIYTAQGGEQFVNIGNFKNDVNTTIVVNNSNSSILGIYYFIDDVSIYELPDIDAGINDSINTGGSMQLNANCTGCWAGLQYQWQPATGLSDSTVLNPIARPTQTTTYYFGLVDTTGKIPCMVDYVDSVTIYVKGVGVNELEAHSLKFKVYPNPNNGNFTLEFSETRNYLIELTNSLGACVYRETINSKKHAIDATLDNGVYILRITGSDNKTSIHKKIIIAK